MDKMAAISETIFFRCLFALFGILIAISLKFAPGDPIKNKPALVEIRARCRIGDKSLFEPILARFTDAYMRH